MSSTTQIYIDHLPTFVIDEEKSAWEGETVHKVGKLENSCYHVGIAAAMVASLVVDFYKNAEAAGLSMEEVKRLLSAHIQRIESSADGGRG